MVRWFIRSIPHGGPIELFHIQASAPQREAKAMVFTILSGIKERIAHEMVALSFLS